MNAFDATCKSRVRLVIDLSNTYKLLHFQTTRAQPWMEMKASLAQLVCDLSTIRTILPSYYIHFTLQNSRLFFFCFVSRQPDCFIFQQVDHRQLFFHDYRHPSRRRTSCLRFVNGNMRNVILKLCNRRHHFHYFHPMCRVDPPSYCDHFYETNLCGATDEPPSPLSRRFDKVYSYHHLVPV